MAKVVYISRQPRNRFSGLHPIVCATARDRLARVSSPAYLYELVGTFGADPFHGLISGASAAEACALYSRRKSARKSEGWVFSTVGAPEVSLR
ncbi:MAG: hypothetical protein LAN36_02980 [Acidobacteriia bacterium]|nr:hypothetical protein [Terriglobia bacterium]